MLESSGLGVLALCCAGNERKNLLRVLDCSTRRELSDVTGAKIGSRLFTGVGCSDEMLGGFA